MEQLLKITSIPMQYEMKVTNARLEYQNPNPELSIKRSKGGLSIKSHPAKLNLDSSKARASVLPTMAQEIKQSADKGITTAQNTTAQFAQESKTLLDPKMSGGNALDSVISQRSQQPTGEFQLGFIPSAPVEKNYVAGDLTMDYQRDKLHFDLKILSGNFEFIAGSIEMSITQYPDLSIEYVGGPLYVPPSSDPNHKPVDVRA